MKEMIQEAGEEVSIVIYDAPLPPKYFRFSKKFIRTLFVVVPVLLVFTFMGLLLWGLGEKFRDAPKPTIPDVMNTGESKLLILENEITELKNVNHQLTEKLATLPSSAPTAGEEPYLMTVKKPYGMQNFMAQNRVNLDQFEFQPSADKTNFKFQIISSSPETRVTGHVIVFMITAQGVMAYPKEANDAMGIGVKYSLGEPFAVSRLRPTNAEFVHKLIGDSVKFVIYIFSRDGDLLLIKESQTYKVGPQ